MAGLPCSVLASLGRRGIRCRAQQRLKSKRRAARCAWLRSPARPFTSVRSLARACGVVQPFSLEQCTSWPRVQRVRLRAHGQRASAWLAKWYWPLSLWTNPQRTTLVCFKAFDIFCSYLALAECAPRMPTLKYEALS